MDKKVEESRQYGDQYIFIGQYYDDRKTWYVGLDTSLNIFDTEKPFRKPETAWRYVERQLKKHVERVTKSLEKRNG